MPRVCEIVRLNVGVVEDGLRVVGRGLFSVERDGGGSNPPLSGGRAVVIAVTPGKAARRVRSSRTRAALAVRGVFRPFGKLEVEIDDMFDVVSGVHLERVDGAANQHASSDHEHQGDGNLGGDEEVAEPAAANRRSCRVGIDRRGERGAGAFQRRGESEQNAGDQGDGKDVGKDLEVGGHMKNQRAIFGGNGFGGHDHRHLEQGPGEQERDDAGDAGPAGRFPSAIAG